MSNSLLEEDSLVELFDCDDLCQDWIIAIFFKDNKVICSSHFQAVSICCDLVIVDDNSHERAKGMF